jgi:hypothetical protein
METIETLKRALERGYFTAADADAIGGKARLLKADWDAGREDGFPRLEAEMANDDTDMKSQAQDLGLWVDYVNPHGMKLRLKFTIPPAREIQLNYRGLCPDDAGLTFFTAPSSRTLPVAPGRAHRSKGIRPRLKRLLK